MSRKSWLALLAAIYLGLSLVSLAAPHLGPLRLVVGAMWSWIWLLGPPILLVHQSRHMTCSHSQGMKQGLRSRAPLV